MPIYEFNCKKCGTNFEVLCQQKDQAPKCPECNSLETEKKLSMFGSFGQKAKDFINQCNTSFK